MKMNIEYTTKTILYLKGSKLSLKNFLLKISMMSNPFRISFNELLPIPEEIKDSIHSSVRIKWYQDNYGSFSDIFNSQLFSISPSENDTFDITELSNFSFPNNAIIIQFETYGPPPLIALKYLFSEYGGNIICSGISFKQTKFDFARYLDIHMSTLMKYRCYYDCETKEVASLYVLLNQIHSIEQYNKIMNELNVTKDEVFYFESTYRTYLTQYLTLLLNSELNKHTVYLYKMDNNGFIVEEKAQKDINTQIFNNINTKSIHALIEHFQLINNDYLHDVIKESSISTDIEIEEPVESSILYHQFSDFILMQDINIYMKYKMTEYRLDIKDSKKRYSVKQKKIKKHLRRNRINNFKENLIIWFFIILVFGGIIAGIYAASVCEEKYNKESYQKSELYNQYKGMN